MFFGLSVQDERHDRCLLQGDSGTHSVTDSYDLNSFGSYVDSDEENHEVRGTRGVLELELELAQGLRRQRGFRY